MGQHGRDNHFVPQFYLKRWSTNGNTILDYRTIVHHPSEPNWKRSPIKSAACWRDLYTQHDQEGLNTEVEDFFSNCIEAPSKTVFNKMDNAEGLSAGDIDILVNFLIAQLFRTPHALAYEAKIKKQSFEKTVLQCINSIERDYRQGHLKTGEIKAVASSSSAAPFPSTPLHIKRIDEGMSVFTTTGRRNFLSTFDNLYNGKVGDILRSYSWKIITVPIGIELPTSDNPVTVFGMSLQNYEVKFNVGIGSPNAIILLPLDAHRALFTQVGISLHRLLQFEPDSYISRQFIKAIVRNADLHIFAKSKTSEIPKLRPRVIDHDKATIIQSTRQHWDEIQVKVDEYIP